MKDYFGINVKIGDTVLYTGKDGYWFNEGVVTDVIDNKVKIKGNIRKRGSTEIVLKKPYIKWLEDNPEYTI